MSNLDLRHPEDGLLLRYLDGELPGRKARAGSHASGSLLAVPRQVRRTASRHRANACAIARMCWLPACLLRRQRLAQSGFCARRFRIGRAIHRSLADVLSPFRNLRPALGALRSARAGAVLVVFRQLRETPNVEAAALLQKAVEVSSIASRRRQAPAHHLHAPAR